MAVFSSAFVPLLKQLSIYFELSKWRVTSLMLITAWVGMELAATESIPINTIFFTLLGIGLIASAAGSLNHLLDIQLDRLMARTERRPLPQGKISQIHVLLFGLIIGVLGTILLRQFSNSLTMLLSLASLFGYAIIYTLFLKRVTTQNIVIGGLAGASPPLLGWTSVTSTIDPGGLLLVLIIFTWTPPHFWSLAIARHNDYIKSKLPILPVTHGIPFAKFQILLYIALLSTVTMLPFCIGMSGIFYLIGVTLLNTGFLVAAIHLLKQTKGSAAIKTFHYSNFYLLMLFACLLMDHSLMRSI
ncbi:MAG: heme o synthase [Rickettsiella sp.]|nr:heme o synthase [Rickettsiella sp.]